MGDEEFVNCHDCANVVLDTGRIIFCPHSIYVTYPNGILFDGICENFTDKDCGNCNNTDWKKEPCLSCFCFDKWELKKKNIGLEIWIK